MVICTKAAFACGIFSTPNKTDTHVLEQDKSIRDCYARTLGHIILTKLQLATQALETGTGMDPGSDVYLIYLEARLRKSLKGQEGACQMQVPVSSDKFGACTDAEITRLQAFSFNLLDLLVATPGSSKVRKLCMSESPLPKG